MDTCKLEYMIKDFNDNDKIEIINLFDKVCDFHPHIMTKRLSINSFSKDSISKNGNSHDISTQEIFSLINKVCEKNKIYPIFQNPTNIDECLETSFDLFQIISEEDANSFFCVKNYDEYLPPRYVKKVAYPVIIEEEMDGFNVTIPDIFGGVTCAENYELAIRMAKDLILLMLNEAPGQCFPPKSLEETKRNFPNNQIVMVEVILE